MLEDSSEFDAIHSEFRPRIHRYLAGLVGPDEAEDICQVVFLKVHRGLAEFRGQSSLATWIYRIATNAAIDRLRRRSLAMEALTDPGSDAPDDASCEDVAAHCAGGIAEPSAESSYIRSEMNDCIDTFVDTLPEIYRPVVVLSDLEGFTNQEIAKILGLTVDTVKIRLHRARRELKKQFESGCDFYRTDTNELACDRKAPRDPSTS